MLTLLVKQIQQQATLAIRQSYQWFTPLLFFIVVVSLFPLAIGNDSQILQNIAPGIIWIAALLATLLSIGRLFSDEIEHGSLDLYLLSPHSLTLLTTSKIIAHWLIHGLPLVLLSPLLGILLHLTGHSIAILTLSLLLGTPVLSFMGAIGAALTVTLKSNSLLMPIIIMPLYIPVLIFGAGTATAATQGMAVNGYVAILGALILFTLAVAPFAASAALRIGGQQ